MNLIFIMAMFVLCVPYINRKKFIAKLSVILITFVSVVLLHSRSGFILYGISIFWFLISKVQKRDRHIVYSLLAIIFVFILLLYSKQLWGIFLDKIIYGNISSNSFRITLISASYKEAITNSPIWGMGIKKYYRDGYPLGSHSTYVGFFYKTGIIGVVLGIYIFFKANWNILKNAGNSIEFKSVLMFLVSFIVLFAIEDVDGANWSIVVYFSMLSLVGKSCFERKKLSRYFKSSESNIAFKKTSEETN